MHARIRDAVHGHRARGERAAEMPHDWDAHWRPVGAEIYVTSCDLGIFRGSAHRADLAPGCRLCCQFPDEWAALWRPLGAEFYVPSCALGIFRGSAPGAYLAPGCQLCCQFPDG